VTDASTARGSNCVVILPGGSGCSGSPVDGRYCARHTTVAQRDTEVFKLVHMHYLHDLSLFWQRSNFYLLVEGALVTGFASSTEAELRVALAGIGLLISLFWFMVARGSVIWLNRWREELITLDALVDRLQVYARIEPQVLARPWESPSWITRWLPIPFGVSWVVLLVLLVLQGGSL
jgi:hypothetical protein